MSTKHTPGPWYRNIRAKGKYPTVFAGKAPKHVHIAHVQQIRDNPEETEANIDLIAAAPELLEALKGCLSNLSQVHDGYPESTSSRAARPYMEAAKAAISKAEGR